jgi:predicted ATPase
MLIIVVLALAAAVGFSALSFGLWATMTKNPALFGEQTGLANIYSFVLAAVVASIAMIAWALHRNHFQRRPNNNTLHPPSSRETHENVPSFQKGSLNGDSPSRPMAKHYFLGPPRDTAEFVGRKHEMIRIEDIIRDGRTASGPKILVITGPSGIGKSTLLVHAAHNLAKLFNHQVIYIDMRGYTEKSLTASDALSDLLRAAGIDRLSIPRELHAKSSLYRAVVCAENSLVLLDNADELKQIEPLLPGDSSCAAIIASRSGLFDLAGAAHIGLGPLNQQEAGDLFAKLVGEFRVAQEAEAASAIVRCCGYLPLAIRIAGARVASRPHRPISYLLNRMNDERARLSELQMGNLEMRTSFEISYRSLPETARKLFRRLSLAPYAEFPYWIASILLQADAAVAMEAMDFLVEAQLVAISGTVERGYYRFHDLLLSYARECHLPGFKMSEQIYYE